MSTIKITGWVQTSLCALISAILSTQFFWALATDTISKVIFAAIAVALVAGIIHHRVKVRDTNRLIDKLILGLLFAISAAASFSFAYLALNSTDSPPAQTGQALLHNLEKQSRELSRDIAAADLRVADLRKKAAAERGQGWIWASRITDDAAARQMQDREELAQLSRDITAQIGMAATAAEKTEQHNAVQSAPVRGMQAIAALLGLQPNTLYIVFALILAIFVDLMILVSVPAAGPAAAVGSTPKINPAKKVVRSANSTPRKPQAAPASAPLARKNVTPDDVLAVIRDAELAGTDPNLAHIAAQLGISRSTACRRRQELKL